MSRIAGGLLTRVREAPSDLGVRDHLSFGSNQMTRFQISGSHCLPVPSLSYEKLVKTGNSTVITQQLENPNVVLYFQQYLQVRTLGGGRGLPWELSNSEGVT